MAQFLGISRTEMQACDPGDTALYGARRALALRNQHLFLVFDEIECIWTAEDRLRDEAYHLLLVLGNSGSGSTSTIVCGETSSLYRLMNGYPVPPRYPARRPSLNSTKYRVNHLAMDPPTDREVVARIVEAIMPALGSVSPKQRNAVVNAALFFAGSDPRGILHVLSSANSRKDLQQVLIYKAACILSQNTSSPLSIVATLCN